MKKPVTLLCLADLHCSEKESPYFSSLVDEIRTFTNNLENERWRPNYLVVAGDIIDASDAINCKTDDEINDYFEKRYEQAKNVISLFTKTFNGLKSHIIFVPGNHDNNIPNELKGIIETRETFWEYCKKMDDKKQVVAIRARERFLTVFKRQYAPYLNFIKEYDKKPRYLERDIIADDIKNLAGVRVFEDDNLCFVPINTEWLYVPYDNIKEKIKAAIKNRKKNKDLTNILDYSVNIVEKCPLCSPLIKEAHLSLEKLYENYTVVTVMHRSPEDLPWVDQNPTDPTKTDSLGMILSKSDVLLTGHEHPTRTASHPTKVDKGVLHFKLGSVGREERMTGEYVRWAFLIHINPISGKVEHLPIVYNSTDSRWVINPQAYPVSNSEIRNRYKCDMDNEDVWKFGGSIPVIHFNSNIDAKIEERIRIYFDVKRDCKNFIVINSSKLTESYFDNTINKVTSSNQTMRIVIYYVNFGVCNDSENEKIQQKTMKIVDSLREKYKKNILLNLLVINEVIINCQ